MHNAATQLGDDCCGVRGDVVHAVVPRLDLVVLFAPESAKARGASRKPFLEAHDRPEGDAASRRRRVYLPLWTVGAVNGTGRWSAPFAASEGAFCSLLLMLPRLWGAGELPKNVFWKLMTRLRATPRRREALGSFHCSACAAFGSFLRSGLLLCSAQNPAWRQPRSAMP